ncbi:MAG: TM2 domain-containing protein [Clostridia bacterium]|nr:TM2 domain-containing protein [Clostridia bacterium]
MERQNVDMYMLTNAKYFPSDKVMYIKEKLKNMDDEKYGLLLSVEMKNPTTLLILSLLVGSFGVDRFMLGDTGMGVLKLLTGGLCGILTIIDWCTIMNKTKEENFKKLMSLL